MTFRQLESKLVKLLMTQDKELYKTYFLLISLLYLIFGFKTFLPNIISLLSLHLPHPPSFLPPTISPLIFYPKLHPHLSCINPLSPLYPPFSLPPPTPTFPFLSRLPTSTFITSPCPSFLPLSCPSFTHLCNSILYAVKYQSRFPFSSQRIEVFSIEIRNITINAVNKKHTHKKQDHALPPLEEENVTRCSFLLEFLQKLNLLREH